jgi:hypothetical protein
MPDDPRIYEELVKALDLGQSAEKAELDTVVKNFKAHLALEFVDISNSNFDGVGVDFNKKDISK